MNEMDFTEGSFLLKEKLKTSEPMAAGKIGINELRLIHNYFNTEECNVLESPNGKASRAFNINLNRTVFDEKLLNLSNINFSIKWNEVLVEKAYLNNGIFPKSINSIME